MRFHQSLFIALLFVGCASNHAVPASESSSEVNVSLANPLIVRGYDLERVPQLLRSELLRSQSWSEHLTLDLVLSSGTYVRPSPSASASDEQSPSITWFVVDYTVVDDSGSELSRGRVSADGPEPISFSSIQMHERAVVQSVAAKLRNQLRSAS